MNAITVTLPLKTTNPQNGDQGRSWTATMQKSRRRKIERGATRLALMRRAAPNRTWLGLGGGVEVTITRVSPGELDSHDGIRAAMKSVVDGVTDALGLKNDRDSRLTFIYRQEKNGPGEYAVRLDLRNVKHQPLAFAVQLGSATVSTVDPRENKLGTPTQSGGPGPAPKPKRPRSVE